MHAILVIATHLAPPNELSTETSGAECQPHCMSTLRMHSHTPGLLSTLSRCMGTALAPHPCFLPLTHSASSASPCSSTPSIQLLLARHQPIIDSHFLLFCSLWRHLVLSTVDKLFSLMTPLVSQGSNNSPCARAVPNLSACAEDGSLQIKQGCCSKSCADKLQQVHAQQRIIWQSYYYCSRLIVYLSSIWFWSQAPAVVITWL